MKTKTTLLVGALIAASIIGIVLMSGCIDEKTVETPKQVATETPKPEVTPVKEEAYKTVTDMRGKEVRIPKDLRRVVVMSDGFIEGTMIVFGVEDKLVGLPRTPKDYTYNYSSYITGENYTCKGGAYTPVVLYPKLKELTVVGRNIPNYETVASLDPDVVILRSGSCSFRCYNTDENAKKAIEMLEKLNLPVVVIKAPICYDKLTISTISQEIEVLGGVFEKQKEARKLIDHLDEQIKFIEERTKNVKEEEKPTILYFGLSAKAREQGGVGNVRGIDTPDAYFVEDIVNAKNAFRGTGTQVMSEEQVLALNPDVLLLPTSYGYHPPRELYESEHFRNIQKLKAIEEKRVYSLPWTPSRCAIRLEFPIDLMIAAKGAYPDRFLDITISEWVLDYYKDIYDVDDEMAKKLRSAQWLEWTVEEGF